MTRLIDLTHTIDLADRELVPASLASLKGVVCPEIHFVHPDTPEAREFWCEVFGVRPEHVPEGNGFGYEWIRDAMFHWGTHVDAPLHSGGTIEGRPARTITDIDINELICDGLVLDLRGLCSNGEAITVEALQTALNRVGRDIKPGDAVMLRTGQERFTAADPEYFNYPGMTRESTLFLTGKGAKVLGTDAMAWDRPFAVMRRLYQETGDPRHVWDGHLAIREKEAFIVQQMANLGAVPSTGFKVGFFPMKVKGASAGPCRAVAFVD